MSTAHLKTRVIYGLKTDVAENAHYITDAEILYPVGNAISIHNFFLARQKLINLSDKQHINIIAVTPNRKYIALCEVGEKPLISIYNLQSLKKKKTLGIPYEAVGVTKFTCISFSFDNKCLAAITDEPDQTMLFYNWEKGKVESSIKLGNPQNCLSIVKHVVCNPSDIGIVAVGGPFVFKFLTVSETVWRPYGFSKADNIIICSMTWLNLDRLFAGTRDGRILYFESGDLKNAYKMTEVDIIDLKIRVEHAIQTTASQTNVALGDEENWEHDVCCLISFQRGFAFAHGFGTIVVFEKDSQYKYIKRNIYKIPKLVSKQNDKTLYKINTINVNPSYDKLVVTTGWSQLFYAELWNVDIKTVPEPQLLKIMGQPLHHGPIGGLSMCVWKPICMTYGEQDRSIRIWNYQTESLILMKQYLDDIYCISLHPDGLFCLVGFSDKLRFKTILIDGLVTLQEFPIRNCKMVCFSSGGHLFAAVNGNIIQIYVTIDFQNKFLLKGHTGKIKGMAWSHMDTKLYSISSEGVIYEWDTSSGLRVGELILKGVILRDLTIDSSASTCYYVSNDSLIREVKENSVSREYHVKKMNMHLIRMGTKNLTMFITCSGGVILSFKLPLQESIEYSIFHLHCKDITQIALTYDEQLLISTGQDGTLIFWKIMYPEGKVAKIDQDLFYIKEVLIGRLDLEEKIRSIKDLTVKLNELETEHVYKIRQLEIQHDDKMKETHQTYHEIIKELKNKLDKLEESRINELSNINADIVKLKNTHEQTLQQMEIDYEAKLIAEYDKYKILEKRNDTMREDYESQLESLKKKAASELKETITNYEAQLHEKNIQLKEQNEELFQQTKRQQVMERLIEDDADREILEIRTKYENILYEERQMKLMLKGEVGALQNRYLNSQDETKVLKDEIKVLKKKEEKYHNIIKDLEKNKQELRKELQERDETIKEKEASVHDQKRNIQELEKYRDVMDYKIHELQDQIEPRNQSIRDFQEKISEIEVESRHLHKSNKGLKLQLSNLREKLRAMQREVQFETEKNKKSQQLLNKIRTDLSNATDLVQKPNALKKAIIKLHNRYCNESEFQRLRKTELDFHYEFQRQRDHLERTVAVLKKQVEKCSTKKKSKDWEKILEENVTLIEELNTLRKELGNVQCHISNMENMLGLKGKDVSPEEARNKLLEACRGRQELKTHYKDLMKDCQQLIMVLKDDVNRLTTRICELETD